MLHSFDHLRSYTCTYTIDSLTGSVPHHTASEVRAGRYGSAHDGSSVTAFWRGADAWLGLDHLAAGARHVCVQTRNLSMHACIARIRAMFIIVLFTTSPFTLSRVGGVLD